VSFYKQNPTLRSLTSTSQHEFHRLAPWRMLLEAMTADRGATYVSARYHFPLFAPRPPSVIIYMLDLCFYDSTSRQYAHLYLYRSTPLLLPRVDSVPLAGSSFVPFMNYPSIVV
jgi:hypothetical protein